ncbi:MAG: YbgF trimerization domain-containing protein, partial [Gammaproteobacteria bacterium]|nr:YbgF trimerization domain-containing protein [Gammaproteobacteria bacterium]
MTRRAATLLLAVLPAFATAATPSTAQRLELLERRVGRITDLTLQLDQVRSENRELRGEIENLGYEIERLKRKQRDIYLDIDQRLGTLSGAGA